MGVSGDAGKAVGSGIYIITGKGKGSKRAKLLSGNYRGRVSCEGYIITCFTDLRPIPSGPKGNRLFKKVSMIEEGVKIMGEVEKFEFQRLALKIDADKIGAEFKISKLAKNYIVHAAYILRGFNNLEGYDSIDPEVENADCLVWQRTNFQKRGRFELCPCKGSCYGRLSLLRFIGLSVEITIALNEANYTLSLQQLIGSKLYRRFTENYCSLTTIGDVLCFQFKKDLLPYQVPLSRYSKAIFERESIPVKVAERQ